VDGNQEIGDVEMFSDWMTSYKTDAKYDIFLSYRRDSDSNRVNLLHWCLLNGKLQVSKDVSRLAVVFLDQYCLEVGKQWDLSFAMALKNSSVNCPVITYGNLEIMKKKLGDGVVDNVLLEWMLAIEPCIHYKFKTIIAIIFFYL